MIRVLALLALPALLASCVETPPEPPVVSAPRPAEEARRASELVVPRQTPADRNRASALMREARAALARRPIDRAAAGTALRGAAQLGEREAQFMLATDEELREPAQRNPEGALVWLTRAAVQGLPRAQFALGEEYASGRRLRREPGWANVWYERAARQGDSDAARALASRARTGDVNGVDEEASYFWSSIAAKLGSREAQRDRTEAGTMLGAEERQEIDAIVAAWRPAGGSAADDLLGDVPVTRFVQTELVANGYDAGPGDGVMGPRSLRALVAFKTGLGVTRPNDTVDAATIMALRDAAVARASR